MATLTPRAIACAVGIAIWAGSLACTYNFDAYVTDPGGAGAGDAQTQQGGTGGRTAIDGQENVDAIAQAAGGQGIVDAPTPATGGQGGYDGAAAAGGREGLEASAEAAGAEAKVDASAAAVGGQGGADVASSATGGTDGAITSIGGQGSGDAAAAGQNGSDAATTAGGGKGGADGATPTGGQGGSDAATVNGGGQGGADAATATGGQSRGDAATADSGGQGGADAGTTASSDAASCSGSLRAGICWYLGPDGSSCQQVCTSHGAVAPGAASHVGTTAQGGSLAECGILLGLLGVTGTPANGTRSDGLGLGCHIYGTVLWWLSSPAFDATASHASARLVCGCTR